MILFTHIVINSANLKNHNTMPNSIAATIFWRTTFQQGQIICHEANWNNGIFLFFIATDDDVKNYSGKNGLYAVMIQH